MIARIVAEQMRELIGQPFIVENKPSESGISVLEQMARAKPDGYTLMVGNVSTNAITPIIFRSKLHIDYAKDVVPVTRLVDVPEFLLVTTANFAPRSVPELMAEAKAHPGKVHYGTVGPASYSHYDMALFAKRAGNLDMAAVHNKAGAVGMINDLVAGRTQAAFLNVPSSVAMIQADKVAPLALVNHERLFRYPDVPTIQAIGFPGVGTLAWQGLFAPAGTPAEVLDILLQAAIRAMRAPSAQNALKERSLNVVPNTSTQDAKNWLANEMAAWRRITQETQIEVPE